MAMAMAMATVCPVCWPRDDSFHERIAR